MKKNVKVGLYSPYLDVLGGGEKHVLSLLQVFAEFGAKISIFWSENLANKIKQRFNFNYIDQTEWLASSSKSLWTLKNFDYFFYVTDGSYFLSTARKNFVFCMVPDKKLYKLNLLNRIKLWNYQFISNSSITTKLLTECGIKPITIPPYIESGLFTDNLNKGKVILTVGRFFSHLHSKNQKKIIETFLKLKKSSRLFDDYKLILAGGLKNEDRNYFNQLRSLHKNNPTIILKPNVPLDKLHQLYKHATYYWHFTGLGVDESKHPEQLEHFGIAPLEAIASGCLTFSHNSGGPKEIIKNYKTGFLFNNTEELIKMMNKIQLGKDKYENVIDNGKKMLKKSYSYKIFKEKVLKII